jgi:S-DNA-T family DNA segregation ATPase FtsK/SpoIIIE
MSVAVKKTCQVSGFLFLISVLFLTLGLVSYSTEDPTWNRYKSPGSGVVHNLTGIVGASLADWGLQLLGSTVCLLMVIGALGAWQLMRRRLGATIAVSLRGGLLLAAVSTGMHLLLRTEPLLDSGVSAGGLLGAWLAAVLVRYINPTGTYLVIAVAVILALFVGTERRYVIRPARQLCRRFYGTISRGVQAITWGGRQGLDTVDSAGQWLQAVVRRELLKDSPRRQETEPDRLAASAVLDEPRAAEVEGASAVTAALDGDALEVEEEAWRDEEPIPIRTEMEQEQPPPPPPAPERRLRRWRQTRSAGGLPGLDILGVAPATQHDMSPEELRAQARFLEQKLRDFGVEGEVVEVLPGPVITMYEFAPAPGVKVNKIVNLQDDLALVMRALSVRVVAPIPGKAVVGIEIPNKRREVVRLRDLLDSDAFRNSNSPLNMAVGKDILGQPVVTDLALIPHLLIAGATGSGKSVGLNSMICSLLFRATSDEVKMIMIDPKMLELSIYDGIPHLLIPVVVNPKQAAVALRRVLEEMERRYRLLAARGVRSIAQYNRIIAAEQAREHDVRPSQEAREGDDEHPPEEKLPYLVVVIDELSDLMMVSSREVEDSLTRIAQMARAAGIHLIVATQRPSVDVLTGVIKANFPARISFQVSSKTDSRTILDTNGAEKLLGRGDMLFLAPGTSKPQRIHGAYVSEEEIHRVVEAWKDIEQPQYDEHFLEPTGETVAVEDEEYDEKYDEAVALVTRTGQASISMLQRRLRVGYNRAARMIEIMEKEGIIGPADGVKPREVLVRREYDEA